MKALYLVITKNTVNNSNKFIFTLKFLNSGYPEQTLSQKWSPGTNLVTKKLSPGTTGVTKNWSPGTNVGTKKLAPEQNQIRQMKESKLQFFKMSASKAKFYMSSSYLSAMLALPRGYPKEPQNFQNSIITIISNFLLEQDRKLRFKV